MKETHDINAKFSMMWTILFMFILFGYAVNTAPGPTCMELYEAEEITYQEWKECFYKENRQ